ncbi:MAG: DUF2953 domain-containing protein [Pelosinus sp.]|nr:DUF2953 domain-containing protein [Pelosinus sp.]
MKLFILFFLAEAIIYYLIMQLKLYFEVIYHRQENSDKLIVKILLFKSLELYSMCIPAIQFGISGQALVPWPQAEITTDPPQPEIKTYAKREQRFITKSIKLFALHPTRIRRLINTFFDFFEKYSKFMRKTISSLHCEHFSWHTACGTGDAATTALMTGLLWSLKGTVLQRIKKHSVLEVQPSISIKPDWGTNQFATAFECIFSIRIGHVITAAFNAFFIRNKEVLENG